MKAVFSYEFAYDAGATQVGAKAWNMARMARWGFVVPKGLAIGVEVYKEILQRPHVAELVAKAVGISAADISDESSVALLRDLRCVIESESLPDALVRELSDQLSGLGLFEASLAVRSSAIGEDGEKNAFAGVHESFLNVRGLDEILKAVLKCFASLWTPQAVAYRRRFDFADLEICGAVLICEMVVAENADAPVAAGVAFSADPETGRRDVFVVETVAGLGDKLVGGAVTPASTKVLASISGFEYLGEYAAPMPQAAMDELLLNLWRLHWAFGDGETAQDVEWAYDGKTIVMLQVRPVTSLPNSSYAALQTQPQIWSNANFKEVLSGIMSPLGWSLIPQYSAERFFDIHHLSGYEEPQGMQIARRFEGRAYVDVSIIQYSGYDAWGILPDETNKSFGGFQPEIKLPENAKVKNGKRSMALMSVLRAVWRGHKQLPAIFNDVGARAKAFVKQDLSGHSKQELLTLWFSLGDEKWRVPFMLSNAMGSVWTGMARQMGAKYLPEAELDSLISGLMSGQGNVVSAQHAYDLHEIAGYEGAAFETALDVWLERHGHRGYNEFDIANPRWRETRAEIEQLVLGLGTALHNPETAKRVRVDAEEKLKKLPFLGRKTLGWTMGKARDGFALRENGKSTLIAALGMSRHIALGFGEKMHDENMIENVEDVFYLSFADIQAWVGNVWDGDGAKQLVADRQLQMNEWENAEPPTDVILVSAERVEQVQTQSAVTGNVIKGLGVSPGVASGVACKISDPSKPQGLKAGGVLVARSTDPSWTPLFLSASAIVVEIGGYLSHGAIVAREFGLPAVVNAAGAYDAIENGDELIVDGNVGRVEIGD